MPFAPMRLPTHIEQGALKPISWIHQKTGQRCWSCGEETELCDPGTQKTTYRCDDCEVEWSDKRVLT